MHITHTCMHACIRTFTQPHKLINAISERVKKITSFTHTCKHAWEHSHTQKVRRTWTFAFVWWNLPRWVHEHWPFIRVRSGPSATQGPREGLGATKHVHHIRCPRHIPRVEVAIEGLGRVKHGFKRRHPRHSPSGNIAIKFSGICKHAVHIRHPRYIPLGNVAIEMLGVFDVRVARARASVENITHIGHCRHVPVADRSIRTRGTIIRLAFIVCFLQTFPDRFDDVSLGRRLEQHCRDIECTR